MATAQSLGKAYVEIHADAGNVGADTERELTKALTSLAATAEDRLQDVADDAADSASKLATSFDRAGDQVASHLERIGSAAEGIGDGAASAATQAAGRMESAFSGAASTIEGDLQGIGSGSFDPLVSDATTAGQRIEGAFADTSAQVKDTLGDQRSAGKQAGESAAQGFEGSGFVDRVGGVAGAAGLALGAALTLGATNALGGDQLTTQLGAQLALSGPEAERAGQIAGDLYTDNFGDSLDQVYEATRLVAQNVGTSFDDVDFSTITGEVLSLATTFDQDLGGTTTAVAQLMRTGLAPNALTALDIIAAGFTNGADQGQDFLDTITEYSGQFQKLGIDGAAATGLITQGLQAGARNGDLVADAFKEFSIRAVDGSKLTSQSLSDLGLNADAVISAIAAGGADANGAVTDVLDALRGVEDPVARSAAAVGLFGTQAEDLGTALFALDPATAHSVENLGYVEGASANLADSLSGSLSSQVGAITRKLQEFGTGALTNVLSGFQTGEVTVDGFAGKMQGLGVAIAGAIAFLTDLYGWVSQNSNVIIPLIAGIAAGVAVFQTIATVTRLWAAAQALLNTVMATNPIVLIVVAIAALVAAFVTAYRSSERFREIVDGVFSAVSTAASTVYDTVVGALSGIGDFFTTTLPAAFTAVVTFFQELPGRVGGFVSGLIDTVVGFFASLPGRALSALVTFGPILLAAIGNGLTTVLSAVGSFIASFIGFFLTLPVRLLALVVQLFILLGVGFVNGVTLIYNTVVTWGTNLIAFFTALPGRLVAGLAALGSLLLGLFLTAVAAVSNAVSTGFNATIDFVAGVPGRILSFLSSIPGLVAGIFTSMASSASTAVTTGFNGIISFVTGIPGRIAGLASSFLQAGVGIIQGLVNGISQAAGFVGNVGRNIVNSVIRFVNSNVIGQINDLLEFTVAGITINAPDIPRIPLLADGGIITRPTLAVVGEAGPEAVVPLTRPRRRDAVLSEAGLVGGQTVAGGQVLNIEYSPQIPASPQASPEEIAAAVGQRVVRDFRNGITRYASPVGSAA